MAVIWACTAFGAICGSSVATTATFGRAALPELQPLRLRRRLRHRHHRRRRHARHPDPALDHPGRLCHHHRAEHRQAVQGGADSGPAGGAFYCIAIAIVVRRRPRDRAARLGRRSATGCGAWRRVWPVLLVALIVVGGIYGGVFTPTEGAAVGAIAMLLVGAAQRRLGLAGHQRQPHADRRDLRHDLHHPARLGGVRRVPGAARSCPTQAAEMVGELRPAALRHHGVC